MRKLRAAPAALISDEKASERCSGAIKPSEIDAQMRVNVYESESAWGEVGGALGTFFFLARALKPALGLSP